MLHCWLDREMGLQVLPIARLRIQPVQGTLPLEVDLDSALQAMAHLMAKEEATRPQVEGTTVELAAHTMVLMICIGYTLVLRMM